AAHVEVCLVGERLGVGKLLQVVVERHLAVYQVRLDARRGVREGVGERECAGRWAAQQLREPQALGDVGARLPGATAVRPDDDHAVRGLGAVNGRRRGPTQ